MFSPLLCGTGKGSVIESSSTPPLQRQSSETIESRGRPSSSGRGGRSRSVDDMLETNVSSTPCAVCVLACVCSLVFKPASDQWEEGRTVVPSMWAVRTLALCTSAHLVHSPPLRYDATGRGVAFQQSQEKCYPKQNTEFCRIVSAGPSFVHITCDNRKRRRTGGRQRSQ